MSFLSHPVFVLIASAGIFILLAWVVLPFAIYGIRQRLDKVVENLDRIQASLDQPEGVNGAGGQRESKRDHIAARRLLVELRKELLQFAPAMKERALDSENIVIFCTNSQGDDIPCLVLSLGERGVQVSVSLRTMEEAFPGFSSDQFRDYAVSFLPEKYGYFAASSPDGKELQVNIESKDSNPLDLFIGIIREQMYEPIMGGAR